MRWLASRPGGPRESVTFDGANERSLQGNAPSDMGHYFAVRTLSCVDEPGPGRVHMQHLVSACDAGMTSFVAGASQQSVEHHPEIQAVVYAQWFGR